MKFNEFNVHHIKQFFDERDADQIYTELDRIEYELVKQERHGHYGHVFKSENPNLPDDDESYAAQFNLAKHRDGSILFNSIFENKVVPFLKNVNPNLRFFLKPNIIRVDRNCFFRAHNDSYAGQIGYTFFFSTGWKWDYGGILTFVNRDGAHSIFPENNSFLIRNEEAKLQHFVGPVGAWAGDKYYYLLVGWASSVDRGDSGARGAYYDFE